MRLTVKLVVWFFLCVLLAVGINGFVGVRAELDRYESDLSSRHTIAGLVLREAFEEVMETEGEARAVSVLEYTDKRLSIVDIRWVHLEPEVAPARRPHSSLAGLAPLLSDHVVHEKAGGTLRTYIPVHVAGRNLSALEFSESLDGERDVVRHLIMRELRAVAIVALAVGIAAGLLGILLVARPMRRLVEHARRIGKGDLSAMAASTGKDEISELGREMNAMCAQLTDAQAANLKALDQLRRAERLSTVGKLASGLAHELGTPLNVITLRAKAVAQGRAVGERAQEAATSIAEQATRMTNLVRQLLDFARRKAPQRDVVDLEAIACRTADLVETVATKANVRFDVYMAGNMPKVHGDSSQLEQVLTNLFVNAMHAMPEGGTVHVSTSLVSTLPPADHGGAAADYVQVSIRDEGTGIAPEALPHLFEPFFTTKDVGEGTGLGLAVCYGIVRDHGGWIDVKTGSWPRVGVLHLPSEGSLMTRVLFVDDDRAMCEAMSSELQGHGLDVAWRTVAEEAFELLSQEDYDVVITDLNMRGMNGIDLCQRVAENRRDIPVIVVTAFGSLETAIATNPRRRLRLHHQAFDIDEIVLAVERAVRDRSLRKEVRRLQTALEHPSLPIELIGSSSVMQGVHELIARVAASDVGVLVTGESGTGKELVAQAIHRGGTMPDGPFVAVNCAAIPEALLESELFGHAKGAFTDAKAQRRGLFTEANGGTLFLDEIGEMPLTMQVKLLRALDERMVRPVGGNVAVPFQARLIAATNRDLEAAVEDRTFRSDLYYRIHVVHIEVPPLRTRGGDILELAQHFLRRSAERQGKAVTGLSSSVAQRFLAYTWPGNVRELLNCVERAVALARFEEITVDDLPDRIRAYKHTPLVVAADADELVTLDELERRYVIRVVEAVGGNKSSAARVLGLDRTTLYRMLARFGLALERLLLVATSTWPVTIHDRTAPEAQRSRLRARSSRSNGLSSTNVAPSLRARAPSRASPKLATAMIGSVGEVVRSARTPASPSKAGGRKTRTTLARSAGAAWSGAAAAFVTLHPVAAR